MQKNHNSSTVIIKAVLSQDGLMPIVQLYEGPEADRETAIKTAIDQWNRDMTRYGFMVCPSG
jgi:hypothetical protein